MELTVRGLWTMVHGMGFGALYLMACSGAMVELWRRSPASAGGGQTPDDRFLRVYLVTMAVLAWLAVLSGAYVIYPWYRAVAPPGIANLAGYPQRLLQSSPATAGWHSIGMEWKEHVAWLAPISITMVAAVFSKYGRRGLEAHPQLRRAVLSFAVVAFLSAGIAGFFGAMLNKKAPVDGGSTVHLVGGQ